MYFIIDINDPNCGRLGSIYDVDFAREIAFTVDTPGLFPDTEASRVIYPTKEQFEPVTDFTYVNYPLANLIHRFKGDKKLKRGISNFAGFPKFSSFCTIEDVTEAIPTGSLKKQSVGVLSRNGKVRVNAEMYMKIMRCFKPSAYIFLHDTNTNLNSTSKRCRNSVDRNIRFAKQCFAIRNKSTILRETPIIGAVGGGGYIPARKKHAQIFAKYPFSAYLISGLWNNGSLLQFADFTEFKDAVKCSLTYLPEDKPRIMFGCWNPLAVLQLVKMGVDLFDTTLPTTLAKDGKALIFPFDFQALAKDISQVPASIVESMSKNYCVQLDHTAKMNRVTPLVKNCRCATCHLFKDDRPDNFAEIPIYELLLIHNTHHYFEFFKQMRGFISTHYKTLRFGEDIQQLIMKSMKARANAYAPYTGYKVGAAVLCNDGSIYEGCNVENFHANLSVCAENCAIVKAVSDGKIKFSAIAISAANKSNNLIPCESCAQMLLQFSDPQELIVLLVQVTNDGNLIVSASRTFFKDLSCCRLL